MDRPDSSKSSWSPPFHTAVQSTKPYHTRPPCIRPLAHDITSANCRLVFCTLNASAPVLHGADTQKADTGESVQRPNTLALSRASRALSHLRLTIDTVALLLTGLHLPILGLSASPNNDMWVSSQRLPLQRQPLACQGFWSEPRRASSAPVLQAARSAGGRAGERPRARERRTAVS